MLKFKLSLLFNNLKFRVAMVIFIITAIALGIIFMPENKASKINTSLTTNDVISEACKLIGKQYWVNPNNQDGFENGWGHGVTNAYVWGGKNSTKKYGEDFQLAEINKFTAVDCTGLIYYTLTKLGCTTTGFEFQNPVPVDPTHWYNYTNPTITYNGQTADVQVLKKGVAVEDLPYYMCENGKEIPAGSIVVAAGSTLGKGYHDHAWIYIGNLGTTNEKEVAKILINKVGVDANLLINGDINGEFTIKTYVNGLGNTVPVIQKTDANSTHWRIESTADKTGYGVYINNGNPTESLTVVDPNTGKVKAIGPVYAFQIANEPKVVTGNYSIELVKVKEDGKTVITSSEALFEINGSEKSTTKGVLNIVSAQPITNVDETISYTIVETQAPDGYTRIPNQLKINVAFKLDEAQNKYIINGAKTTGEGFNENATFKISEDKSKITVYVLNESKDFDLSLRKYISKINGKEVEPSRVPVINEKSIEMLQKTGTASYYHNKNSIAVKVGDEIEYTLRVYNEGKTLGYAKQITDYLPEGLSFVKLAEDNSKEYTTTSKAGSKEIVINYSGNTQIKSLRDFINSKINVTSDYYQEVKVICKVEDTKNEYITSRAEITNYGYEEVKANGEKAWKEAIELGNSDIDSIQNTIKTELNLNTWYVNAKENTYKDEKGNVITDKNYYPGAQDDDDFETVNILSGKYKVIIKKVDKDDETKTLQGAYFTVKGSNIANSKKIGPTGENGLATVVENVRIVSGNETHTYTITETQAPTDYNLYEGEIDVTVKTVFDGTDFVIDSKNVKVNGKDVKYTVNKENTELTIIVPNAKKEFDLSLRKFITEVNEKELEESRIPQVDISNLVTGESTTATYVHPKEPVLVHTTDIVTYTIRVYNEGEIDGYASKIMDDIPEGLTFVPATYDEEEKPTNTNAEYAWTLYREVKEGETPAPENTITYNEKTYVITDKVEEAEVIVTDYLSKENGTDNLIKAFDGKQLSYKDVKVSFKVTEPTTSDRILTNYAQITEHTDYNGNPTITDRDSTPNKWVDNEDDQDTEKVKVKYFDLSLLKWVSKAIVVENGTYKVTNTGHTGYENPEPIVKVDLKNTNLKDVVVKFEYTIKITNEGEIAGYAKEISDYIPEGLKFVAEDNSQWKEVDGKIVTRQLENTLLQPGESASVTVLLTWINSENNLGLKVNVAEISEDYNDYDTPDIDSTPNNKVPNEDDIDDAPVMLQVKTGSASSEYFGAMIGAVAIIVTGIVLIRKKVLA